MAKIIKRSSGLPLIGYVKLEMDNGSILLVPAGLEETAVRIIEERDEKKCVPQVPYRPWWYLEPKDKMDGGA